MTGMFQVCMFLLLIVHINCYSTGAPPDACADMFPTGHGVNAQSSTSPYTIIFSRSSNTTYTYTVTVTGGSTNFKGFLIKARTQSGAASEYLGTFTSYPSDTQLGECGNGMQSVTHKSNPDRTSLTFVWAPTSSDCSKTILFHATVVQTKSMFWTDILSSTIDLPADCYSASQSITLSGWSAVLMFVTLWLMYQ